MKLEEVLNLIDRIETVVQDCANMRRNTEYWHDEEEEGFTSNWEQIHRAVVEAKDAVALLSIDSRISLTDSLLEVE